MQLYLLRGIRVSHSVAYKASDTAIRSGPSGQRYRNTAPLRWQREPRQ